MRRILQTACVCSALLGAGQATAHPHVWVTVKSEVIYAPDGSVAGLRHAWAFDAMFSTFATQGIVGKQKGAFTREELRPLAETQVGSLKEFDYFTFARIDGEKAQFTAPTDFSLEFKDGVLELTFVLVLKDSKPKPQRLEIDIYDPTTYVDLVFDTGIPVRLEGAPMRCAGAFARQNENLQELPSAEPFFESGTPTEYGSRILNKIRVRCP
jgi:ABC-type uncharacterized transport system substrate-binding protein